MLRRNAMVVCHLLFKEAVIGYVSIGKEKDEFIIKIQQNDLNTLKQKEYSQQDIAEAFKPQPRT